MNHFFYTIIIGGGQGGLSVSYFLKQHHVEHIVLEQAAQAGFAWREQRWDSFTLNTPNWSFKLPGATYEESNPEGYLLKAEIVTRFEQYIEKYDLPVLYQQRVTSVERKTDGSGFVVLTETSRYESVSVVISTGLFQRPKIPPFSSSISPQILQLGATQYRNPGQLPPGAVLVVGSAQTGCQIADELNLSGRKVYLATGGAGRVPRRYRGKDFFEWLQLIGFVDRTPEMLPSPAARFAANPQISGVDGGKTLNLHKFARDGMTLLGHIQDAKQGNMIFAPDLKQNLAKSDQVEIDLTKKVDDFILRNGLNIEREVLPRLQDGYQQQEILELDSEKTGIGSIIWANGFNFDFKMVKLPVFDAFGFPIQTRGQTEFPGLSFAGLPWMPDMKSGLLLGVAENAAKVAEGIVSQVQI